MEAFNFLLLFSLSLCRSSNFTCNGGPRSLTMLESEKVQAQGSACLFACQQAGMANLLKLVTSGPLVLPRNQTFQKLSTWTPSNSKLPATPPAPSKREHHHLSEPSTGAIMANPPDACLAVFIRLLEQECGIQTPPAITTLEETDALVPEPSKNKIPHPPPAPNLVMTPTPPPPPDLTGMDLNQSKQKPIN